MKRNEAVLTFYASYKNPGVPDSYAKSLVFDELLAVIKAWVEDPTDEWVVYSVNQSLFDDELD